MLILVEKVWIISYVQIEGTVYLNILNFISNLQSIPHMASNGNEIFYEVHIRQIGETQTKRIEVKEMINKVDLDLKCRNGYIISVYAVNEYGLSSVFGSVTVPPNGSMYLSEISLFERDNSQIKFFLFLGRIKNPKIKSDSFADNWYC